MKNLLFVIPSYEVGGTVVSTLNLLSLLDINLYNITVLSLCDSGELKTLYRSYQKHSTNVFLSSMIINSWREEPNKIKRYIGGLLRKMHHFSKILDKLILKIGANIVLKNYTYDTIIACQEGITTQIVSYMKCVNKIAWVRCDYRRYMKLKGMVEESNIYKKYNSIICVSKYTSEIFKQVYPQYAFKVYGMNNPQNSQYLINRGNEEIDDVRFKKDNINIVSVGRYDVVKRFHKIPYIAQKLKENGLNFVWYIVGPYDNDEGRLVMSEIKKYDVGDNVIMLGFKTNPYSYIRKSNLLVCLSKSEACPRIINEAKILGTPTVCTDFPTAKEYITNGKNGIITSIDLISNSIEDILTHPLKYNQLKENIAKFKFDNKDIMNSLYHLL